MHPYRLRKWKDKLKEWGYEKHLHKREMKFVAAKGEKRFMEEGKDTLFFHGGILITKEKIENFKRRKVVRESDPASPSAREYLEGSKIFKGQGLHQSRNTGCYHLFNPMRQC
jgi:hypothetical protein